IMKSDEIYFFILWITRFEEDNHVYGYLPPFFLMGFIHIQGLITRIFDGFRHFFHFLIMYNNSYPPSNCQYSNNLKFAHYKDL
ncbi:MAG TPA: hypothetical protein DCX82_01000, partial [Lachnospiraceae bacterium]|nr:hypothetical protein [Lachnospiraceae bacterium]